MARAESVARFAGVARECLRLRLRLRWLQQRGRARAGGEGLAEEGERPTYIVDHAAAAAHALEEQRNAHTPPPTLIAPNKPITSFAVVGRPGAGVGAADSAAIPNKSALGCCAWNCG